VKSKYISVLKAGDDLVNEPFLLQDIARRKTKDGRPFLLYTLRDKTGQANGIFWDVPAYIENWVNSGLVVLVTGRVANYKDALQISATDMNPSHEPNMADFLPTSKRPLKEMIQELHQQINRLDEPWQTLVAYLLLEEDFLPRFVHAPAARNMHHAYIGGLLEHSLSMATLARQLAEHYPYVNKNLLVTGALLHDLGKTIEYTTDGTFGYSEDGRLVGHIVRAIVMIEMVAAELGFPEDELRHLIHLVASHHGTHEWGSPVLPKTLEAILLHQIDLLDSRVQGFFDYLSKDSGSEEWTLKSSPMFSTELRRPPGFSSHETASLDANMELNNVKRET
jgi:3'-5' exoribonuclease